MGMVAVRTIRVALVEDHAATRAELVRTFARFTPRIELVCAYPDAESFLPTVSSLGIEVALIDLGLPGITGTETIRILAERAPSVRALALTAFDDEASVIGALSAGAYGYMLKDESEVRLMSAVEEAAAGEHPVSSRVAGFLISRARRAPPPVALSDREEELANALANGLSYAECTAKMGISIGTVQSYVKRLYRKLDVNSRKEVREWVGRYLDSR